MPLSMPILVAAINARHSHASLGARYLLANMGDLRPQTELAEFTFQQSAAEIADAIAAQNPASSPSASTSGIPPASLNSPRS
jgi:hypothetical protein